MNSNLTLKDIEHIQALVDWIYCRAKEYCRNASPSKAGDLDAAVSNTKAFLNGYAAALKHQRAEIVMKERDGQKSDQWTALRQTKEMMGSEA
jgi:hypothetical protein|nr:MAG TPA_asm: hypothetical protein [Caudoviricetes sp.]